MTETLRTCCQCGNTEAEAAQMVKLENKLMLCDQCVDDMHQFMVEGKTSAVSAAQVNGKTPRGIVSFLDQYIVGQDAAKKTLAIAIHNHYKRLNAGARPDVEIDKSNILLLGPTGTGKTLLAKTLARMMDVPFTVADATSLTQAGYVGDDVETVLQRLIQAADGDIAKAERGIVFIDEVDKIAAAKAGPSITRDVSGEGVQQALLKIIEGAKVSVQLSGNRKTPNGQSEMIDTKEILFIFAGAFVHLLEKLNEPVQAKQGMGFVPSQEVQSDKPRKVTPEMLSDYGMIPEFVGRLPIIQTLDPLDVEALERILTQPKNAVVRQMQAMLALDGATLKLEDGAVRAIAEQAHKLKTGARGARSILEELLKDAQFEVPDMDGSVVTVKADLTVNVEAKVLKLAA